MGPENRFHSRNSFDNFEILPMEPGICPVKLFPPMYSSSKLTRFSSLLFGSFVGVKIGSLNISKAN
jgi:hypothetical protein